MLNINEQSNPPAHILRGKLKPFKYATWSAIKVLNLNEISLETISVRYHFAHFVYKHHGAKVER